MHLFLGRSLPRDALRRRKCHFKAADFEHPFGNSLSSADRGLLGGTSTVQKRRRRRSFLWKNFLRWACSRARSSIARVTIRACSGLPMVSARLTSLTTSAPTRASIALKRRDYCRSGCLLGGIPFWTNAVDGEREGGSGDVGTDRCR